MILGKLNAMVQKNVGAISNESCVSVLTVGIAFRRLRRCAQKKSLKDL